MGEAGGGRGDKGAKRANRSPGESEEHVCCLQNHLKQMRTDLHLDPTWFCVNYTYSFWWKYLNGKLTNQRTSKCTLTFMSIQHVFASIRNDIFDKHIWTFTLSSLLLRFARGQYLQDEYIVYNLKYIYTNCKNVTNITKRMHVH